MVLYLNGKLLPGYNTFKETPTPNAPSNVTLDGTMYVDFINRRRKWTATWDYMKASDYATVRALYDLQFKNHTFLSLYIVDLNITTSVYVTMSDREMIWNNSFVQNLTLTFDEQYAVS